MESPKGKQILLFRTASFFLVISLLPCAAFSQQELDADRFSDYPRNNLEGFADGITIQNAVYTAGTTGALYLLSYRDENVRRAVQKQYYGLKKIYLDIANEVGNPLYALSGAGSIFWISMLTDNSKFQDAAFTSIASIAFSIAIVGSIKFMVGRARPFENRGPHDFTPFSFKHNSFPSGHTSTAFALTVPWIVYYPSVLTYTLFIVPTGTALARIAKDKHWLTDVIAGGLIGGLTGYYFAKRNKESRDELLKTASTDHSIPILYLQYTF